MKNLTRRLLSLSSLLLSALIFCRSSPVYCVRLQLAHHSLRRFLPSANVLKPCGCMFFEPQKKHFLLPIIFILRFLLSTMQTLSSWLPSCFCFSKENVWSNRATLSECKLPPIDLYGAHDSMEKVCSILRSRNCDGVWQCVFYGIIWTNLCFCCAILLHMQRAFRGFSWAIHSYALSYVEGFHSNT